jgi:hypothetical protein
MAITRINMMEIEAEQRFWEPTAHLRWFRPPGCDDNERVLQQLWERVTGEREWRTVPTCLAD